MIKECTVHVRIRDITPNPGNSEKNKIIVQLNGRATVQQIERWRLQVRARIPENTPSEEDILFAKEER